LKLAEYEVLQLEHKESMKYCKSTVKEDVESQRVMSEVDGDVKGSRGIKLEVVQASKV
jgi:hypothetical protein